MQGTVTPPCFHVQDVASWLSATFFQGLGGPLGLGLGGLGSVRIGRLKMGKQGPVSRHSVQDGYIEVRVDRHGSHVGNPFAGAPTAQLCRAYDELLLVVLTVPLVVDECLHDYEGLEQDSSFGRALLTPYEKKLLQTIADKHGVKIHQSQRVSPFAVRAWLVYHAMLLLRGISFYLFCWCVHGYSHTPPWACHSQSLMGALLWVAVTLREQLAAADQRVPLLTAHQQVFLRHALLEHCMLFLASVALTSSSLGSLLYHCH
mmetsp:Transcript_64847/g.128211  ORF Transcript_64847/g.128211 Transcript_64847/m.128211 type:complete len:260 (+) Transcript_64847:186-965(+)